MHFEYRTSFPYELAPSITIRTLALVTADFHSHDQIFHANRKTEQADRAETILPNGHDDTWDGIPEFAYFRKSYFISVQLRCSNLPVRSLILRSQHLQRQREYARPQHL